LKEKLKQDENDDDDELERVKAEAAKNAK